MADSKEYKFTEERRTRGSKENDILDVKSDILSGCKTIDERRPQFKDDMKKGSAENRVSNENFMKGFTMWDIILLSFNNLFDVFIIERNSMQIKDGISKKVLWTTNWETSTVGNIFHEEIIGFYSYFINVKL